MKKKKVNKYGLQRLTNEEDSKLDEEKRKMKMSCPYCGKLIHFYAFEKKNRQLCSNCKRYVFKDKKAEYDYRIKEMLRKVS